MAGSSKKTTPAPICVGFCLALGACSDARLTLELPPLPEGATIILGIRARGGLRAFAANTDVPLSVAVDDENASLELLAYDAALEDLKLAPEELSAEGECDRSCRLVSEIHSVHTASYRDGELGGWVEATASADLLDFVVPEHEVRCSDCVEFEVQTVELPNAPMRTGIRLTLSTEEGPALIGLRSGELYRVHPDGAIDMVCQAIGPGAFNRAANLGGEEFWVVSLEGRLFRFDPAVQDPSSPCVLEPVETTTTAHDPLHGIALGAESPRRIFGLTTMRELIVLEGDRVESLAQFDIPREQAMNIDADRFGRVLASAGGNELALYDGKELKLMQLSAIESDDQIEVLAFVEGIGVVVGLWKLGLLLIDDQGRVEPSTPTNWDKPGSLLPYRGGVFVTQGHGGFRLYLPGVGYCPQQFAQTQERVYETTRLGDRDVILGDITTDDSRPTAIALLRAPRPRCDAAQP